MPSSRQCLAKSSTGNFTVRPLASVNVCDARSTFTAPVGSFNNSACTSGGTTIGNSEFFSELPLKMSANEVLITARNPYCVSAQGACSRELPQPKLSPASKTLQAFDSGLFKMKSGFGLPSASYRQSLKS